MQLVSMLGSAFSGSVPQRSAPASEASARSHPASSVTTKRSPFYPSQESLGPRRAALDPYAEIEKVPLQTKDGMKSRGFTVRF